MPTYTIFNKGCVFDDFPLVGCILGVDVPTFWWSKNKMFGDIVPTLLGHTKSGDKVPTFIGHTKTRDNVPTFIGHTKTRDNVPTFWRPLRL